MHGLVFRFGLSISAGFSFSLSISAGFSFRFRAVKIRISIKQ